MFEQSSLMYPPQLKDFAEAKTLTELKVKNTTKSLTCKKTFNFVTLKYFFST